MKVWAAINDSHDGILDFKLFKSEMLAKMFVRDKNKKAGFCLYEIREVPVYSDNNLKDQY